MIGIVRLWIQHKGVKYEKNIFPLQLSRRNGNSGGMLLPHLPQVQFVEEAFLRNTWKGCLAGPRPQSMVLSAKNCDLFLFRWKFNHIHFQNGGSQNGSPDIRYCIFFLSMMMIRHLCNCGILLWQRLKKIWCNDSCCPYMAQVLYLLDSQWANHQTRKKWQMAFVDIFLEPLQYYWSDKTRLLDVVSTKDGKSVDCVCFIIIRIFWGKKISLFARKE